MPSVILSGATGFIAQHCVQKFLDAGYKVIGTVRSTEKGDKLKANLKNDNFSYEIVKDISEKGAFDEVVKNHPEATYFAHTASPFHFQATDVEKELLIPAVHGTKNALQSIKQHGPQIKRVVITSSIAAVLTAGSMETYDESSWNAITWDEALQDPRSGYRGSKTFAEKAAWDFMEQEKPQFTVNFINPCFVFGPQLFDSEVKDVLNTSSEILNQVFQLKKDDQIPPIAGAFVDVRDVAKAHVIGMEIEETDLRLLLETEKFTLQYVVDILRDHFPELKERLPVGTPNTEKEEFKKLPAANHKKSLAILGDLIPLKQSVIDSIGQLLEANK